MEQSIRTHSKRVLVDVARAMLDDKVDFIEGARAICRLRLSVGAADDPVFLPIQGFESETDVFPTKDARHLFVTWNVSLFGRIPNRSSLVNAFFLTQWTFG